MTRLILYALALRLFLFLLVSVGCGFSLWHWMFDQLNALHSDQPDVLLENFGWLRNEVAQTLLPTTVPDAI